jgi:hypothetical protein
MHDYNHQNGTHRPLFKIKEVQFQKFIDNGHHSKAFYNMPTASTTLSEKIQNPILLTIPKTLKAHLENYFPSLVIFHGDNNLGKVAQIHLFVPESETHTRTYVLTYGKAKHPIFNSKFLGKQFLGLAKVIVEQDSGILGKIYPNTPQKIKLNNEIGMDWVRRNFENWTDAVVSNE